MVPRLELFHFSISFNRCLRRCRRQTFERTRIEQGDIYLRVKTTDAKSEDQFVSKYKKMPTAEANIWDDIDVIDVKIQ